MKLTFALFVVVGLAASGFMVGPRQPLAGGSASYRQQSTEENISFKWAFGALTGPGENKKFVTITRDTILKSGDELKMLVELTKECFVYVIHSGPKGDIDLLFPENVQQFSKDYKTGKNYYIPKGRKWMELDANAGRETFYLLASTERLTDLEALVGNYLSAEEAKKAELGKSIVGEIKNVRKHFKNFATIAEKPITIGGNVRGLEKAEEARRPDVADIETQITASNFYSKTFTIDHQ